MTRERRYIQELRAAEGDDLALVGYAATFNTPTVIAGKGTFTEVIAPGAFTRALAEKQDVTCLFNHDANKVLGRTASGTLTLEQDSIGLKFRCQLDPTNTEHRNIHSSVKRGDINSCSFAFLPHGENGESWNGTTRTLKDVDLFDASIVTRSAYPGTSVQARNKEAMQFETKLFPTTPIERETENLRTLLDAVRLF